MNTTNKVPVMIDLDTYYAMGIDPKTGLPLKAVASNSLEYNMKPELKKTLRIMDEQDAVNRFKWTGLEKYSIDTQLMERILYYRGRAMLFKIQDKFYFLPYALDGSIDVYGRFTGTTPLPFGGGTTDNEKKAKPWIQGLVKKPVYSLEEELTDDPESYCVLLNDYTPQISQSIIPRCQLQEPYLEFMADCLPFCRTALLNGTGVSAMRVNTEDEQSNVSAASRLVNRAALTGQKWIPIVGQIDFQDLTGANIAKAEEFLLSMQSVDNIRLSMYGIGDGAIFEKKAHMLETEAENNQSSTNLIMADCYENRKRFCTKFLTLDTQGLEES